MIRHGAPERALAYGLAAVAGFVDATGFLETGGFFVSFMTGNSTRLGVGIALERAAVIAAIALIGSFVLGVVCGAVIARRPGIRADRSILLLVAATLAFAGLARLGRVSFVPASLAAFSMGLINLTFRREGEVSIAIGYMTGTLVRFGMRLADAMEGLAPFRHALPFLAMWLALVSGVAIGAIAGRHDWTLNYFIAAIALAIAAMVVTRLGSPDASSS